MVAVAHRESVNSARLRPWTVAATAACGCAAVAIVDPEQTTMSPACPFRLATGWWCPACGATRATSQLVRGDFSQAFRFNLLWFLTIPLLVAAWLVWAFPRSRELWLFRSFPRWGTATQWVIGYAVLALAFTVSRNTGFGLEHLRFPGA